jgi:hypothetical protein
MSDQSGDLKRVIIRRAARFQSYVGLIAEKKVSGFCVTFVDDLAPVCLPSDPDPTCYRNSSASSISLVE